MSKSELHAKLLIAKSNECRDLALTVFDAVIRERLLELAGEYERLAASWSDRLLYLEACRSGKHADEQNNS